MAGEEQNTSEDRDGELLDTIVGGPQENTEDLYEYSHFGLGIRTKLETKSPWFGEPYTEVTFTTTGEGYDIPKFTLKFYRTIGIGGDTTFTVDISSSPLQSQSLPTSRRYPRLWEHYIEAFARSLKITPIAKSHIDIVFLVQVKPPSSVPTVPEKFVVRRIPPKVRSNPNSEA